MDNEIIFGIIIFIFLIVKLIFFGTLHSTMNKISKVNRQMSVVLVWLNLIPIFSIFWPFIFNSALSKSIEEELKERKSIHKVNLYSGTIVYPISSLSLLFLVNSTDFNTYYDYNFEKLFLPIIFLLSTLYFWIVFWSQINRAKRILESRSHIPTQQSTYNSIWVILTIIILSCTTYYLYQNYGGNSANQGIPADSTTGNIYEENAYSEKTKKSYDTNYENSETNDKQVNIPNDPIFNNPEDYFDGQWKDYALHFMLINDDVHGLFQIEINGTTANILYRSLGEDIEYLNYKVIKTPLYTLIIGNDANGQPMKFKIFEKKMSVTGFIENQTNICYEWFLGC
jgi:hypothetical protein